MVQKVQVMQQALVNAASFMGNLQVFLIMPLVVRC